MSFISEMDEDVESFSEDYSRVLENLRYLLKCGKIGLSYFTQVDVQVVQNECVENLTGFKQYHFVIKIPYAGRKLSWDIIFDPEDYLQLPDFDFNDDTFLSDPEYDYIVENVPHWKKWDLNDPQSLLVILNEFLELYKKVQIEKLSIDNIYSRFKKEFEELRDGKGISGRKVEVYVDSHVSFLVEIPVDCSPLPEYIQNEFFKDGHLQNPREDFAHLNVTILKLDNSSNKATLQLSPRLDQLLGKLAIPTLKKECTLLEYVTTIENILKSRIEFIVRQFNFKKEFMLNFVNLFCYSIVEYDTDTFSRLSFIYELDDYQCLVTVKLGPKFPQDKPRVQLSSIYCQDDKECNQTVDNFFFSAIDNVEQSLNHILKALKQAVVTFKKHTH